MQASEKGMANALNSDFAWLLPMMMLFATKIRGDSLLVPKFENKSIKFKYEDADDTNIYLSYTFSNLKSNIKLVIKYSKSFFGL